MRSLPYKEVLRDLVVWDKPYSMIFGSRGSGKTRMTEALVRRGRCSPLLVPIDFPSELGGVRSYQEGFAELVERFREHPEFFWYALLAAGMRVGTWDPAATIREALALSGGADQMIGALDAFLGEMGRAQERTSFSVDGLEESFRDADRYGFTEGIYMVIQSIIDTPSLSGKNRIRLFLRPETGSGLQNIEQLEDGVSVTICAPGAGS